MGILRERIFLRATVAIAVGLGCLLVIGSTVRAQSVGVETDLAVPVGDAADEFDLGWGVAGRAGFDLPVPGITLALEAFFDYTNFGLANLDETMHIWRILGGLRFGLGIPYVPDLFVHLGYGSMVTTEIDEPRDHGFAWDIGLSSDLVSLGIVSLGLHVAFKKVNPHEYDPVEGDVRSERRWPAWIAIGLHGEFGF